MKKTLLAAAIVGPTASGKSRLAIQLSEKIPVEIVNYDSLQLYKYFDIGTAKPTLEEREKVPHHLIDILYPDQEFNAWMYKETAKEAIKNILAKGKIPLLVGGTGLYLRALEKGLFELKGDITPYRRKAKTIVEEKGLKYAHELLKAVDPRLSSLINPNDRVRIERALEVYFMTGRSIVDLWKEKNKKKNIKLIKIGLLPSRDDLYKAIDERVERMFEAGWVQEVKRILAMGYSEDVKPLKSIGYREVLDVVRGRLDVNEAKRIIKKRTKEYARRQIIWLRKEDVLWFHPPYDTDRISEEILAFFKKEKGDGS